MTELHAWFHCYADGADWKTPTADYLDALVRYGLYDELASLTFGFHGCADNIERVETYLRAQGIRYDVAARSPDRWEQATLIALHEWCQDHDGYVSYAHSKGAGFQKPVQTPWRRGMLYHNIVRWQHCVELLDEGRKVVGCHYMRAAVSITDPSWGWSGMFAGNFWWTKADVLRHNVRPTLRSRLDAEHWLFQLTEVMDVSETFVANLNARNPGDIAGHVTDW